MSKSKNTRNKSEIRKNNKGNIDARNKAVSKAVNKATQEKKAKAKKKTNYKKAKAKYTKMSSAEFLKHSKYKDHASRRKANERRKKLALEKGKKKMEEASIAVISVWDKLKKALYRFGHKEQEPKSGQIAKERLMKAIIQDEELVKKEDKIALIKKFVSQLHAIERKKKQEV